MYKIITAIGNDFINKQLKATGSYDVLFSDIAYQEALIDIISNKEIDKIILYDKLPGELSLQNLIKRIIEISSKTELIIIVEKNTKEINELLESLRINKIINSKELTIDLLNDTIVKEVNIANNDFDKESNYINSDIDNKEIKQNYNYDKKIITVSGNNGSGKTTFASNLALTIARNTGKKVLLLDLDTVCANIDKFFNIDKINKDISIKLDEDKACVLNCFTETIQKNIFDYNMFLSLVIQYGKCNNLHIITGNTSMFVCQNVLCEDYYSKILEKAKELYDYIVIDTNSSLFLDATKWALEKADIIYYILEGSYKDMSCLKNSLSIFSKSWDILLDKIELILNKKNNYSLSKDYIQSVFNLKIKYCFDYNSLYFKALNNSIPIIYLDKNIEKKYKQIICIQEEMNILEKIKLMIGGHN